MAPVMGITFFALLLIAPVAILVVLGVFKLIAWLGNSLLGRTNTAQDEHRGLGFRHMIAGSIAGAMPICLIVLLLVLLLTVLVMVLLLTVLVLVLTTEQ